MTSLPPARLTQWRKPPPIRRRRPFVRARSLLVLVFVLALLVGEPSR